MCQPQVVMIAKVTIIMEDYDDEGMSDYQYFTTCQPPLSSLVMAILTLS
jgi:hypothetical protein